MYEIIQSDIREASLPNNHFQCIITSPPYWQQRDYGSDKQLGQEKELEDYITNLVSVFNNLKSKLKNDGLLWINIGDSYAAQATSRFGDKSRSAFVDHNKEYKNEGRTKQLHNIPKGMKHKDIIGVPWELAKALRSDGWYLRTIFPWIKTNVYAELAAQDRFSNAHEYWLMLAKQKKYKWNKEEVRKIYNRSFTSRDYFYLALENGMLLTDDLPLAYLGKTNKSRVHYATFPENMIYPLIIGSSNENDTILDPFNGSGTVGVAAIKNKRNYVGVELIENYVTITKDRLKEI